MILPLIVLAFAADPRILVNIEFEGIQDLNRLSHLDIHYDHHRTSENIHAFVTQKMMSEISSLGFDVSVTPNLAFERFQALKN